MKKLQIPGTGCARRAMGAGIHGYVPENFMTALIGKSAWRSISNRIHYP